jgi:hypothetical protein
MDNLKIIDPKPILHIRAQIKIVCAQMVPKISHKKDKMRTQGYPIKTHQLQN